MNCGGILMKIIVESIFVMRLDYFFPSVPTLESGENLQKGEIVKWTKWSWNGACQAIIGQIPAQRSNF
jgi:hypothetical protein